MKIKAKLSLNVILVLVAISIIVVSALISSRTLNRNIFELTQKTTPYQLKALNQQRTLQAHVANQANLSASRGIEEFKNMSAVAIESLAEFAKATEELQKLKAENSSTEIKAIADITKQVSETTEQKIKARETAMSAVKPIQEKLRHALDQLGSLINNLQQKSSSSLTRGIDNVLATNRQLENLIIVRDCLKDMTLIVVKIPTVTDKRSVAILRDDFSAAIIRANQALKNVQGRDKKYDEIIQKLLALNEKVTASRGLAFLKIKNLSEEDEEIKVKIETMSKDSNYTVSYILPTIDKEINNTQALFKGNTNDLSASLAALRNTNIILSTASKLSLLSAALSTDINNCLYAKDMTEFEKYSAAAGNLLKETNSDGQKLVELLVKGRHGEEAKLMSGFLDVIGAIHTTFAGAAGVAEKVKSAIKSVEALDNLNLQMRKIVAKQMEETKKAVAQAGKSQENVVITLNQTAKQNITTMIIVGALIGVIILIMGIWITKSVTKPIHYVAEGLSEGADQVATASDYVSTASSSLADGASRQSASIEETSSSMEEMSAMTKQNAANALQANTLMKDTSSVVHAANQAMQNLTQSMNEISTASEETGKIIKTIDEIAFQTNLLALNAAVEAARAGEAGAGFAVVADEVRNLAMRAAEAAKSTANLIAETIKKVKTGSELVSKANESFQKVAASSQTAGTLVAEIAAASQEQAQGIEQINKAIADMEDVIQQNASSSEESSSAAEELNSQAKRMKNYVRDLVALVKDVAKNDPRLDQEALVDETSPVPDSAGRPASAGDRGLSRLS